MKSFLVWPLLLMLSACYFQEDDVSIKGKNLKSNQTSAAAKARVFNVSVVNDQLVIDGADLLGVTTVQVTGDSFNETFSIESKSASQIIANGLRAISFGVGKVFSLILADAYGAATFQVNFTLDDGSVAAAKLSDMGAGDGDVLIYNSVTPGWEPRPLSGLNLVGTWDANTNTPMLSNGGGSTSPLQGDYYVVGVAGAQVIDGKGPWDAGDWIIFNGQTWDKVTNTSDVTSFNGRQGPITPEEGDYTVDLLGDVDTSTVAPNTGEVLKWDGTNWAPAADEIGTNAVNSVSAGVALNNSGTTTDPILDVDVGTMAGQIPQLDAGAQLPTSTLPVASSTTDGILTSTDWNAFNSKEAAIAAGTTAQYFRGDKTWATLDNLAVGLGNVDNVKQMPMSYLSTDSLMGGATPSDTLVSSQNAVKTYVDNAVAGSPSGDFKADGTVPMTGDLDVGNNVLTNASGLRLNDADATLNYVEIAAPINLATNLSLVLPDTAGASGEVLTTDGTGLLSWSAMTTNLWTLTGSDISYSSGNVGVNVASPTSQLEVQTSAATKPALEVKAAAAQTANLVEIKNDLDANLLTIDADGDLTLPRDPTSALHAATKQYVDNNSEGTITAGTTAQYFRGDKTWQTLDTSVVPENTNLYFTNARARASISATAPLSWDATTGAMSFNLGAGNQLLGMDATGSAAEYKTLSGTANQVSVAHAANSVTLSTPQNIHTAATPTFGGMSLTGSLDMGSTQITSVADPTLAQDAATKNYVDTEIAGVASEYVNVTGDTMTGSLGIIADAAQVTLEPTAVTADAGLKNSIPLKLRAKYDSDTTTGVISSNYEAELEHVMTAGGSTPASRLAVKVGGSEKMSVTSSGNVGIGTTAPERELHVSGRTGEGDLLLTGRSDWLTGNGRYNVGNIFGKNAATAFTSTRIKLDGDDTSGEMMFYTATASSLIERMRINPAGNVGIGTTNPTSPLEVRRAGGAGAMGFSINNELGSGNRDAILRVIPDVATDVGGYVLKTHNGAAGSLDAMAILPNGNVGIGTTTPTGKLHTEDYLADYVDGTINTACPAGYTQGDLDGELDLDDCRAIGIVAAANGNVGVGTTAPDHKLHIAGDGMLKFGANSTYGANLLIGAQSQSMLGTTDAVYGISNGNIHIDSRQGGGYETYINHYSAGDTILNANGGNVGIGASAPTYPLHVKSTTSDRVAFDMLGGSLHLVGYADGTTPYSGTNSLYSPELGADMGFLVNDGSMRFLFNNGGWVENMRATKEGNLGIGTITPNDALDVVGDVDATGCFQTGDVTTVGGTCVSDKRLKKNIRPLQKSLKKFLGLRPVKYVWRPEFFDIHQREGEEIGLIAQEVEEEFPEIVVMNQDDGYKRVRYDISLKLHLVQAFKEFFALFEERSERVDRKIASIERENEQLRQENQKIKNQNLELKARLERIEKALNLDPSQ